MLAEPVDSVVTLVTSNTPVEKKSHNQEMRKTIQGISSKEKSIKNIILVEFREFVDIV